MAAIKTVVTNADVAEFINAFVDTLQKRQDSFDLITIMENYTGHKPRMWGPSIIGFGSYQYTSDRGTQQGEMPLVGFSPRKAAISLYVFAATPENETLLEQLGKFKMGKSCIYIKKLSDINTAVLKDIMGITISKLQH